MLIVRITASSYLWTKPGQLRAWPETSQSGTNGHFRSSSIGAISLPELSNWTVHVSVAARSAMQELAMHD